MRYDACEPWCGLRDDCVTAGAVSLGQRESGIRDNCVTDAAVGRPRD